MASMSSQRTTACNQWVRSGRIIVTAPAYLAIPAVGVVSERGSAIVAIATNSAIPER